MPAGGASARIRSESRGGRRIIKALQLLAGQRPVDESFQCPKVVGLIRADEADRITDGIGPPSAADPMHVVFGSRRKIEVHHVGNTIHVDAAGRDVRRHQNAHDSGLEFGQGPQTLVLRTVGVQRRSSDAILLQSSGDPVCTMFHLGEDQHHFQSRITQEMLKHGRLQMTGHFVHRLGHCFCRVGATADLDRLRRL